MQRTRYGVVIGCVLIWCIFAVHPTAAEWFLEAYAGATFSGDGDARVREGAAQATGDADFDVSFTAGARLGRWFTLLPWLGVALDGSFFTSEVDALFTLTTVDEGEITTGTFSGLLLLRLPLGRLQPYVGIGPALFISNLEVDTFADTSVDIGLDVRAGLGWQFSRGLGIFGEYRFTHVEQEFKDTLRGVRTAVRTDLSPHHVLVGFSLRF